MLRTYFLIAWRHLTKHRFYAAVNIAGLSIGIAFAFLIGGYVWSELQVNSQIRNVGNQYIIQSKWKDPNMGLELTTLGPLGKALHEQYPNLVENYYRWDGVTSTVSRGAKKFREGLQIGDSSLLTMYGFKLIHSDVRTALTDPFSVVITEESARKYFGTTDVVGQTLTLESFSGTRHDFMVTGVLQQPHDNSILHVNVANNNQFFLSLKAQAFFGRNLDNWQNQYIVTYIELQKGVTPQQLNGPLKKLVAANAPPAVAANLSPYLLSLNDYYRKGNNGLVQKMLYTLSGIVLLILVMAFINFVNISIGRSATRMREIGVRKVMGSMRRQLLQQFLTESILLATFATGSAVVLYAVLRPYFSTLLGKPIPSFTEYPAFFLVVPIAIAVLVGVVAGLYPAIVLSSFKAVDSLKGKLKTANESLWFRKSLVGFQFAIATIVFVGALVISKQIAYFFSNDLGYNKDYVVSAKTPRDWSPAGVQHMESLRQEFAQLPQLQSVSLSYEVPDGGNAGSLGLYRFGGDSTTAVSVQQLTSDENYATVYGIPMAAGNFFKTPSEAVDSSRVVINESTAKALGWNDPANAVGQQVKISGAPFALTVSGVTRDFHFGSMQTAISPLVFLHVRFGTVYRLFSFKLKPGNVASSLAALQKKWEAVFPFTPFEYSFMDDDLKRIYQSELQLKEASFTAAALAFVIVLLGVVGLIALSIQKRTKEIGIRKILGASVPGIISLFLREFLILILVAGLVACPVAFLLMQGWLNNYAYRIPLTMQPFLIAMVLLTLITTVLICLQTIKTALDNPVKSLRTE